MKTEVVIKDGTRAVNWLVNGNMTLHDVLAAWVEGWYPVDADKVSVNGRLVLNEHLNCKVGFLRRKFGEKLVIRVESILPKKDGDVGNG